MLFVHKQLSQMWPDLLPAVTPHFPGDASCWSFSVLWLQLGGFVTAQLRDACFRCWRKRTLWEYWTGLGTGDYLHQMLLLLSFCCGVIWMKNLWEDLHLCKFVSLLFFFFWPKSDWKLYTRFVLFKNWLFLLSSLHKSCVFCLSIFCCFLLVSHQMAPTVTKKWVTFE